MRTWFIISLIAGFGLVLLSGCGIPALTPGGGGLGSGSVLAEFQANYTAKAQLAGTTWSDPDNTTRLVFSDQAKLMELIMANRPPELANVRIDGQPFDFTIPAEIAVIGGRTITTTLTNTSTVINPDGSLQMTFMGDPAVPLVKSFTFVLNSQTATDGDQMTLTGLTGSFYVNVLNQSYPVFENERFSDASTPIVKQ